jgi:hypothetical protein
LVRFERRGIPAVGIATAPFTDEAIEQARLLGMPGCQVAYIPHPVQLLSSADLAARADAVFPAVLAALTGNGPPGPSAGPG